MQRTINMHSQRECGGAVVDTSAFAVGGFSFAIYSHFIFGAWPGTVGCTLERPSIDYHYRRAFLPNGKVDGALIRRSDGGV